VQSVRLWLTGDEEIPASLVIEAGLSRSCPHCSFGVLKRDSVPMRSGRFGPDFGQDPCPAAGVAGTFAGFMSGGLPAPIEPGPSARDAPPTKKETEKTSRRAVTAGTMKLVKPLTPLIISIWNPLQHPLSLTTPRNPHDPAPITIEAAIVGLPGSQSGTSRTDKNISSRRRNQTPNHPSHQPAAQPSAACKKRFCLLFRRL